MSTPKLFAAQRQDDTLIVTPLRNIGGLAEKNIQPELDDIVGQLDQPGLKNLLVDFGKIAYFGSSMLEAILQFSRRIRDASGKLALCNVSDVGLEILHVARFDTMWPLFASQAEALASFKD